MSLWVYCADTGEEMYPASEQLVTLWEMHGKQPFMVGWHGIQKKVQIREKSVPNNTPRSDKVSGG